MQCKMLIKIINMELIKHQLLQYMGVAWHKVILMLILIKGILLPLEEEEFMLKTIIMDKEEFMEILLLGLFLLLFRLLEAYMEILIIIYMVMLIIIIIIIIINMANMAIIIHQINMAIIIHQINMDIMNLVIQII